jgi:hypothetical protein
MHPMRTFVKWSVWNSLPSDIQRIIEEIGPAGGDCWFATQNGQDADNHLLKAMEYLKKNGELFKVLPEELKRWQQLIQPVMNSAINNIEAQGLPGKKFFNRMTELVEKYSEKQRESHATVGLFPSNNQHRVTEAIKTVAPCDSLPIGFINQLFPAKSSDQHEERRFGQVEVGHNGIDHPEAVPRQDKEAHPIAEGLYFTLFSIERRLFDEPYGGSADTDNAASFFPGHRQLTRRLRRKHAVLAVDGVFAGIIHRNRPESIKPDMQRGKKAAHAHRLDFFEQSGRKV